MKIPNLGIGARKTIGGRAIPLGEGVHIIYNMESYGRKRIA